MREADVSALVAAYAANDDTAFAEAATRLGLGITPLDVRQLELCGAMTLGQVSPRSTKPAEASSGSRYATRSI